MTPYCLCHHCARHIKRYEAACPFCGGSALMEPSRRAARAVPAHWLAYGSALAALGCTAGDPARPMLSEDATTASEMDAVGAGNGGEAGAAGEATTEDAGVSAAELTFAPADGSFPCSWQFHGGPWDGAACDRATQYCFLQGGIDYSPDGCRSFNCGPNSPSDAGCGSIEWDAATCDGGFRGCSCLILTNCSARTCSDDDAGGVVLSCGQCYGAPPRRGSERRRRRQAPKTVDPRVAQIGIASGAEVRTEGRS